MLTQGKSEIHLYIYCMKWGDDIDRHAADHRYCKVALGSEKILFDPPQCRLAHPPCPPVLVHMAGVE